MEIKDMIHDKRRLHKATVNTDICFGCMRCVRTCCYDVWRWDVDEKLPVPAYSEECVACLQCMYYCPSGAITIIPAEVAFYDPLYDPFGMNDVEDEQERS